MFYPYCQRRAIKKKINYQIHRYFDHFFDYRIYRYGSFRDGIFIFLKAHPLSLNLRLQQYVVVNCLVHRHSLLSQLQILKSFQNILYNKPPPKSQNIGLQISYV